MSLLDDIEADNAILVEGDLSRAVTLTDPTGPVYLTRGIVSRIGARIDTGTGLRVPGAMTEITVRLSALGGALPLEGWGVATTDVTGGAVTGKAEAVMLDRMAGRVTLFVRV